MPTNFRWMRDPSNYVVEIPGNQPVDIVDGYSRWIMVHGADFDLTEEVPREHHDDFRYAMLVSNLLDGGIPRPIPYEETRFFQFEFGQNRPEPSQPGVADRDKLVSRLPLRHRNLVLPPEDLRTPDYAPLDDIEREKLILVGIIDDAINFVHERFRTPDDKSRVDFAWIQDADRMQQEPSPSVPFGREWTNSEINDKIRQFGDCGDDVLLREFDVISAADDPYRPSPVRLRTSHGTHVMDLAAGYDPTNTNAINRRFISVQLPALSTQDTSGAGLIAAIRSAAMYIFDRAKIISEKLEFPVPVVLNLSYGFNGGPRTGLHVIERTLRRLAYNYRRKTAEIIHGSDASAEFGAPVELVIPAGNAHLTRSHAYKIMKEDVDHFDLNLRLQPSDRTSSYVELWFAETVRNIKLLLTTPAGVECPFEWNDPDGDSQESQDRILALPHCDDQDVDLKTIIARASVDTPNNVPRAFADTGTPFRRLLISFAPTERQDTDRLPAPHGLWKLSISTIASHSHAVNAWIQRDIAVSGFGIRGRQPYFDEGSYEETRHDRFGDLSVYDDPTSGALVIRDNTISGIATNVPEQFAENEDDAIKSIAVGGHRWDTLGAAVYSAAGQAKADQDPELTVPAFTAISDASRVLPGILAAGSKSGSTVMQNGTSVAAPQVVRYLADVLENLPEPDRRDFEGVECLKGIAHPPPRPDEDHEELASNQFIRYQRVDHGLLNLQEPAAKIERGIIPKIRPDQK